MDNKQAIVSQVKGFLEPVFIGESEDGHPLMGLDHEGFEMVMAGYACSNCLAYFDTYTISCPICHTQRDVAQDVQDAPQLWVDHLRERAQEFPTPRRPINPMEEILKAGQHADVDQIRLSQLKPSRPGARRS